MAEDPYAGWSLSDRLQLLAFEAELAHLPRSLIAALWEAIDGQPLALTPVIRLRFCCVLRVRMDVITGAK